MKLSFRDTLASVSLCRSRPCFHSLPTSCDPAALASGLVCVLLRHDHLVRNRWSGELQSFLYLLRKCNAVLLFFFFWLTYLDTNLSLCNSQVCRSWKHHDLFDRCLPLPFKERISQRALSDADLCALLSVWPVIGVTGEMFKNNIIIITFMPEIHFIKVGTMAMQDRKNIVLQKNDGCVNLNI